METTYDSTHAPDRGQPSARGRGPGARRTRAGFWLVGGVYLLAMLGGALPVPLYTYWAPQMGFGPFTTTLIFAAYAVGVVVSLLFFASWSDQSGRRPMLAISLVVIAASTVCFVVATDVIILLIGRLLSGVATGIVTATAAAAMDDLAGKRTSLRVSMFAAGANLGGLGLGVLIAGLFAQFAPDPTRLVFWVYLIALLPALVAVTIIPETVPTPTFPTIAARRPALPDAPAARVEFGCAAAAVFAVFAVNGLFTSLVPGFLRDQMHVDSVAIVVAVVGLLFVVALATQILAPVNWLKSPVIAPVFIVCGGLAFETGLCVQSMPVFVVGTVFAGIGGGLAFRHGVAVTARIAEPSRRANLFATYFLVAYVGLTGPTLALGVLEEVTGPNLATLILTIGICAVVITSAVIRIRHSRRAPQDEGNTPSGNTFEKGHLS